MSKLYLVVRADLPPAQQAVQAAHALQAFNLCHPSTTARWVAESNTLALLEVDDEAALCELACRADFFGVECAQFREPDLGDSLTALALSPDGKRLVRGLRMALARVA